MELQEPGQRFIVVLHMDPALNSSPDGASAMPTEMSQAHDDSSTPGAVQDAPFTLAATTNAGSYDGDEDEDEVDEELMDISLPEAMPSQHRRANFHPNSNPNPNPNPNLACELSNASPPPVNHPEVNHPVNQPTRHPNSTPQPAGASHPCPPAPRPRAPPTCRRTTGSNP